MEDENIFIFKVKYTMRLPRMKTEGKDMKHMVLRAERQPDRHFFLLSPAGFSYEIFFVAK